MSRRFAWRLVAFAFVLLSGKASLAGAGSPGFGMSARNALFQSTYPGSNGTHSTPLTICIDPGHSKATVGARGRIVTEYQIAWKVALKLESLLNRAGYHVVLTKKNVNENVRNEDRAGVANRAHAALFVRLHCDAGSDTGVATFYPDRQGVKGGVRGPSKEVIAASRRCALLFHRAMVYALKGVLRDRGVRPDTQTHIGGQQGALTGSIFSQAPVLLVEMCVLTNRRDEAFIASEQGQERMAEALIAGVRAATGER